jgi:hypothetical protein
MVVAVACKALISPEPYRSSKLLDEEDCRSVLESQRFTQFADEVAQLQKPVYEGDYQWDSTAVGRWETLAKTLPAMVTRGSIVVERGRPHFKGPPLVECPRCNTQLTHEAATLTFRHAPAATQVQRVEAWVCSCGEFYVPGEIAREAYLRAFGRDRYPLRGSVVRYDQPTEPVAERPSLMTFRIMADVKDDRRAVLTLPPEVPTGQVELVVSVEAPARSGRNKWPCQAGSYRKTEFWMAPDFDAPLDEFKEYME